MEPPYSDRRKIDPSRQRPDGTPLDNDRVETGPTALAFREWADAGLAPPDLALMRAQRLERLRAHIRARDFAAVLFFDPMNIRYASDAPNMQLWNTHNPFLACLVFGEGPMIIWDFKGLGDLLTTHNPLITETRSGPSSFFYFATGDRTSEAASAFAEEIDGLMRLHAPGNRRLAIDKIQIHGLRAFEARGVLVLDGEELAEKSRSIKSSEEILAMRCAVHSCERAIGLMHEALRPGLSEDDVWAVLHVENIRRGGEWIETRLLASGPRTNPWFQECGPRIISAGELLAFDTDLVGVYGFCTDMSRTWLIGDGEASTEMKRLYAIAREHVEVNTSLLRPGVSLRELAFGGHQLPEKFRDQRYPCRMHGVGLCDEWPLVAYPEDWVDGAFDNVLEPGMILSVEAYVGAKGGAFGIKHEDQVLITDQGHEVLTLYPHDPRLI